MSTRVAVTGAGGRMGGEVIEEALDRDGVDVAFAVNRSPVEPVRGVDVHDASDLPSLLEAHEPDALVDFTGPESTVEYVDACAEAGVPVVVGTTGFIDDQDAAISAAAETIPILRAANFSRGVAALRRAVRTAVASLPGYDVEVTETHHNGKWDAPSGTALTLVEDIQAEREDLRGGRRAAGGDAAGSNVTHGREGDAPRAADEIGVHARRAGDIPGEHEVLLAGDENVLELTHRAGSRRVFAAGALDAAVWLAGREAGEYDFREVLE